MRKIRPGKKLKGRLFLFILLALIMAGLIIGKAVVAGREAAQKSPQTTGGSPPEETAAEPPAEKPAPPETTSEKSSLVALPAATPEKPVTVNPDGERWELTLVNLSHRLPEKYAPKLAAAVRGSGVQMDARAAGFYQKMYEAAKKDGCLLTPYSGYCSFAHQQDNYDRKVSYYMRQGLSGDEAHARANRLVLPAGCSEHNLGLSMDIVSASSDFSLTGEFVWLTEHAQDYGFILRYPESKEEQTGLAYQPWHWRYVGVKAAREMKQSGQCLEEYAAQ